MKKLFLLAAMASFSTHALGATVHSAKLDEAKQNILIDVSYGGGCGTHEFSLELEGCLESFPVQCHAELIHKSNDPCEAFIGKTISISLKEARLDDGYFQRASLVIYGDEDWRTNKRSRATVYLP